MERIREDSKTIRKNSKKIQIRFEMNSKQVLKIRKGLRRIRRDFGTIRIRSETNSLNTEEVFEKHKKALEEHSKIIL